MMEYGTRVRFSRNGKVGEIIGFMRHDKKYLVKFAHDVEMWIPEHNLEVVEDDEG